MDAVFIKLIIVLWMVSSISIAIDVAWHPTQRHLWPRIVASIIIGLDLVALAWTWHGIF